MWGNLKNIGSKMEQIGNVIAPALAVDDDEEDYSSEYEDEDDEYEEDEEEEEAQGGLRSPFGFVGMLTKALDKDRKHDHEDHIPDDEVEVDVSESTSHRGDLSKAIFDSPFNFEGQPETPQKEETNEWDDSYDIVPPRAADESVGSSELVPDSNSSQSTTVRSKKYNNAPDTIGVTSDNPNEGAIAAQMSLSTESKTEKTTIVPTLQDPTRQVTHVPLKEKTLSGEEISEPQVEKDTSSIPGVQITVKATSSSSPAVSKTIVALSEEPRRPNLVREKGSVSPNTHKVIKHLPASKVEPTGETRDRIGSTEEVVELESPRSTKTRTPDCLSAPPLQPEEESDEELEGSYRSIFGPFDKSSSHGDPATAEPEKMPQSTQDNDGGKATTATTPVSDTAGSKENKESSATSLLQSPPKSTPGSADKKFRQRLKLPPPRPGSSPSVKPKELKPSPNSFDKPNSLKTIDDMADRRVRELEEKCKQLEGGLKESDAKVHMLETQLADISAQSTKHDEELFIKFQEKEARLLQAAAEDHDNELNLVRGELEGKLGAVQRQLENEQNERLEEVRRMERQLEDAKRFTEKLQREAKQKQVLQETAASDSLKGMEREMRMSNDKLAQTMALLDEREEQVIALKASIKKLQSTMTEHKEGAQEAEEEMDELHAENESLRQHIEVVESQCAKMKMKVEELQSDSDKLSSLKLELRMMQEDRDRERAKSQSVTESTSATSAQLESQRDALAAEVQDLKQQLAGALADVDIARADTQRAMTANSNLQNALEAFQAERESELGLMEDQRRQVEETTAAAHAAAIEATMEANEAAMRQLRNQADSEIALVKHELSKADEKNERLRLDNVQMRRSLDEAIQRLQSTQEDVIDRSIMKNILLDWLSKPEAKERRQVLEVMANLLHFSEEEKGQVRLTEEGALGKIVHSVAQLPPAKADVEHLEGENVREKWVNFLLAETDN